MIGRDKGFTLIELLIVVAIIGILSAIAIPSFIIAIENSKRKATMSELRNYGNALGLYYIEHDVYPVDTDNIHDLYGELVPYAVTSIAIIDKWNWDLVYDSDTLGYTVKSLGKNGTAGGVPGLFWDPYDDTATYADFNLDILFSDGQFASP